MKKRVFTLLMSFLLATSMLNAAYAVDLTTDGNGNLSADPSDEGTHPGAIFDKDGNLTEHVDVTVKDDGSVEISGGSWKPGSSIAVGDSDKLTSYDDGKKPDPNPDPSTPDPKPDDKDDDDDDDDDSRGGGGGGASSKYKPINNQNQTPTPNTPDKANQGWRTPSYYDVPTTEWYHNAVLYVSEQGMMAGNNGYFSPNDRLTRGMMAQILYNIEKTPSTGTAAFPDVTSSDWFANAAAWASAQGFMSGYSNGRFGPNDPITREQLAAILFRYSSTKGYNVSASAELSTFPDNAATSDWAVSAMRWAVGTGLLSGKTGVAGTRLDPTGTATRAEVAQILMNFGTKIAQ